VIYEGGGSREAFGAEKLFVVEGAVFLAELRMAFHRK
jgi:hypothetical protein